MLCGDVSWQGERVVSGGVVVTVVVAVVFGVVIPLLARPHTGVIKNYGLLVALLSREEICIFFVVFLCNSINSTIHSTLKENTYFIYANFG